MLIDISRSVTSRARRAALAAVALLVCSIALGACGSSSSSSGTSSTSKTTKLDTKRVEASIEESIEKQRHKKSDVTCPTEVEQKTGVTFECKAVVHNSGGKDVETPFEVTVTNEKGFVTYVGK
ncbi:MAG TPA: DUF4333 domain-containing protein [Solirubrobacteraceae bacterium]|jgi:maltose-binding protein MalE|nr:DUF4333 domain-containing protein [Solirubrobacteraceae bacterium]